MMNRSSNPLRGPPIATVRREQVAFDPLLDSVNRPTSQNFAGSTEAIRDADHQSSTFSSQRLSSAGDITDLLAEQILQESRVSPIDANEIVGSKEGILKLANHFAWSHIVRFTMSISAEISELSSLDYFSILLLRFEALYRLKMYDELLTEINHQLKSKFSRPNEMDVLMQDNNIFDIYCAFRVLTYEVHVQTGHGQAGFHELQQMQTWLNQQLIANPAEFRVNYWMWSIDLRFANYYIRNRNWKTALQLHRKLLLGINGLLLKNIPSSTESSDLTAAKIMLLCRIARLLLQIGARKVALSHFEEASLLSASSPILNSDGYLQSLLLVTQGLILFSEDKYDSAADVFSTFLEGDWVASYENSGRTVAIPTDTLTLSKSLLSLFMQAKDENLYCSAINNYCICCLYLKRNSESIMRLEKLIGSNPPRFMTDPVVFNLCTMYDLSYSPDMSLARKKALQKISAKFGLNDPILNWRSFRLN